MDGQINQRIHKLFSICSDDRGIYIRSVNPIGPAGLSGLVKRKDRILSVDNQPLKNLSNMAAANLLRNTGNKVTLVLGRKKGMLSDLPEIAEDREIGNEVGVANGGNNSSGRKLKRKDKTGQEEDTNKGNRSVQGEGLSYVVAQRHKDAALEKKWLEHAGPDKVVIVSLV